MIDGYISPHWITRDANPSEGIARWVIYRNDVMVESHIRPSHILELFKALGGKVIAELETIVNEAEQHAPR